MRKLVIERKNNKNRVLKEVSGLINDINFSIDKDLIKQILFELILNAQKYGKGEAAVCLDHDESFLLLKVENEGGFCLSNQAKRAGEKKEEEIVLSCILRNNDRDNYGLYDIINEIVALSGVISIQSGGNKITFYEKGKFRTEKTGNANMVNIEIYFTKS